ncbi:hypothetical protein ABZ438_37385 [Streptomyces sp. NPDC005786]|uniref:hypothetical protein n=1 Tax=Streptomyces sp. NPDC005786 TaxID=3154891 RepID=UPI0033C3BBEC
MVRACTGAIEEAYLAGRGLACPDERQVRRWARWHRWVALAVLAHAFLAVTAATNAATGPSPTAWFP